MLLNRLRIVVVSLVAVGATMLPAAPASAICSMEEPTAEKVVSTMGYGSVQYVACNVTYKVTGCPT